MRHGVYDRGVLEYQRYTPGLQRPKRRGWSWREFAIAMSLLPISFLMWLGGMEMGITGRPEPTKNLIGVICAGASLVVAIAGTFWSLAIVWRRFS